MSARRLALVLLVVVVPAAVGTDLGAAHAVAAPPPRSQADTAQIDVDPQFKKAATTLPPEFAVRVRVLAAEPPGKISLDWRYGGEAQGGAVIHGNLGSDLEIGQWTESVPLISLAQNGFPPPFMKNYWFITFVANSPVTEKTRRPAVAERRGVRLEFEFRYRDRVVKTFDEAAPDGTTVGIAVPHCRLAGGKTPDAPEFLAELSGLAEYAQRRAAEIEALPWRQGPLPKRYMIASDISGYGAAGYGIRHSNKAIIEAECRTLRQMGVNALRAAPPFLHEMARRHEGFAKDFGRGLIGEAMGMPVDSFRKGRPNSDPEIGCPFGTQVPQRTAEAVRATVERNRAIPVEEVWALTVDEIGTVMDRTPEGKTHMNTCPRCIEAFRRYARNLGATPADFDCRDWNEVQPAYGVEQAPGATAYYSRKFNNYATAQLFVELRKALDEANRARTQPAVYSYALRGNTFLMAGHSLDFFDFYRFADNAFVYETSNTGPQIWQWDSYLCDVGRVVSATMDKRFGIYIKPHRGAPVQRALSAVSRGARMIYWYTYGPDYFKGDSFADNRQSVALASKAAHLIGKCEETLYGSTWAVPAEVAIVKPRCSEFLGNDAQWENAKWVYTALAHAHVPVDPIDEVMLAEADLSKYKAIYVNGSHLPRRAAERLASYVERGGRLWTSGWGCARDEANRPLIALQRVLGLEDRAASPELWYQVQRYRATAVQLFADSRSVLAARSDGASIVGEGAYQARFLPVVGREVLKPTADTRVLARFADGGAAMTVHAFGKGSAYVVGFYPGLEYSTTVRDGDYDMSKDFEAARRSFIAVPALEVARPVVETSIPAVEAILLKNGQSGKRAVTLMNWAYRTGSAKNGGGRAVLANLNDVKVTIRHAGPVAKITSAMLDKPLPISHRDDAIEVTVPRIEEGDVLVLE